MVHPSSSMTIFNSDKRGIPTGKGVQLDARLEVRKSPCWVTFAAVLITGTLILLLITCVDEQTFTLFEFMDRSLIRPTQAPLDRLTNRRPPPNWHNLLVEKSSNYTSTLTNLLLLNSTSGHNSTCHNIPTNTTKLEGLPKSVDGKFLFRTDMLHHLTLVAYGEKGTKRCAGGDYFEVDLHDKENAHYRSRLPTVDFGNGSYGLELSVPSRFAGAFKLEIWLLFSNWHGMDYKPDNWVRQGLVLGQDLHLQMDVGADPKNESLHHAPKKVLKQCTQADFDRTTWKGRWTRSWFNDTCKSDGQTRFRCLPEEHYQCEEPWCFGPVGRLESNGWQYSAHCSFKIFQREEAWKCLNGRWFLMWGDSNFQDTVRNLLLFILDWKLPVRERLDSFELQRNYETGFVNSHQYDQMFKVSQVFNGAKFVWGNGEGLHTLKQKEHQEILLAHFNGTSWPDTIIMNSGLHDGQQFKTIQDYADGADFAIEWWVQLYASIAADRRPDLIWRTTVAPAGESRKMQSNPNKMEMFNHVMVEKLQQVRHKLPVKFIDTFDLTFPFHYDNEYSDGGHYGRAPGTNFPPWKKKPHWYFVDIMLAHIFLNAACQSLA